MIMVTKMRSSKGSITALSAALAFMLVTLGVGFFFFVMFMNAQKETKNAIDAGTLNIARQSLDKISVKVLPNSAFFDVTSDKTNNNPLPPNCDGEMNLRRVNRMWAEAMLFKVNALGAESDGTSGSGTSNASTALSQCRSLSDSLADKLKDQNNLQTFFTEVAKRNSVRMIGQGATIDVIPGGGWQTSQMEKEKESNVVLGGSGGNFFPPAGFNWNGGDLTPTRRNPAPQGSSGITFFKGYTPITLGGDDYFQVPFLYDEKPHMVARSNFDPAKTGPASWSNPIPNAFSAEGVASQPGRPAEKAISWAMTNPRQTFKASIPTSFVHIKIETPEVQYYFLPHIGGPPVPLGFLDSTYDFTPSFPSATALGFGVLCTTSTADAELGLDTTGRTVDRLVFDYPGMNSGDKANLEQNLVSRCNEMISKPGVTINTSQMHSALNEAENIAALIAGVKDFYVYSPDGEHVTCRSVAGALARGEALWLPLVKDNEPDGSEKSYGKTEKPGPPSFGSASPDPLCTVISPVVPGVPCGVEMYKLQNFWKSGTGFNHCLGLVRSKRSTDVITITISVVTVI